ncbi:MAG: serine hydroxymethyltransferase [Nitrospirae bacterium]|nr:MAG: serine hydroxymethyltransferase [Nitrospirota bacterium]
MAEEQTRYPAVAAVDPEVAAALEAERRRENETLVLIASENYCSQAVLEAQGSLLTNKYAEGYPGKRYYAGCENADTVERLAIERAKELFGADHANVQPHSGSSANMAAYLSVLKPGDKILGMALAHGGHLTHGAKVSFSGKIFTSFTYGVDRETGTIDMEEVARIAAIVKPKMIVTGASAYPRFFDWQAFRDIADEHKAYLMADIAHIAGMVATGHHPSPVPYADFVTTTTHKTLRGPRGGMVLCKGELAAAVDKILFPGLQGGPLVHVIAAKAVALKEAQSPEFEAYQGRVVANAKALAARLVEHGFDLVSGGTDNHLMLVDLRRRGITGAEAEAALHAAGITCNKNGIPFDPRPPVVTSGIRLGTPIMTTRGMGEAEAVQVADWIRDVLADPEDTSVQARVREEVRELCRRFPAYP